MLEYDDGQSTRGICIRIGKRRGKVVHKIELILVSG